MEIAPSGYQMSNSTQKIPEEAGALAADWAASVRPLIDLVDSLRTLGVDKIISLPRIAVVGDQSAGKSSVLEAISGIELPRGIGIVTKCPLELRMKCDLEETRCSVYAATDPDDKKVTTDLLQVGGLIKSVADPLVSNEEGFSKTTVIVELVSPNVPDLTLIDLPGIARVSTQGQAADLPLKIKKMIKSFICNENTIILVVVNGCNDLATTEGLKFAQEVDPRGERTVGVITKIDLVDKGAESEVKKALENEVFRLDLGYTAVRNRSQQQLTENVDVKGARKQEADFFAKTEPYSRMDPSLFGVSNLSKKLTNILVGRIRDMLPGIKAEITERIQRTNSRLEKLGDDIPEGVGRFTKLISCIVDLSKQLSLAVDGKIEPICSSDGEQASSLLHQIEKVGEELRRSIFRLRPAFGSSDYKEQVQQRIQQRTGRELSIMVNTDVFASVVADHVNLLRVPVEAATEHIGEIVLRFVKTLVDVEIKRFPALQQECKMELQAVVDTGIQELRSRIKELINIETEPFTLDPRFQAKFNEAIQKRELKDGTANLSHDRTVVMVELLRCYIDVLHETFSESTVKRIRYSAIQIMTKKAEAALQGIIARAAASKDLGANLLQEAHEISGERERLKDNAHVLQQAARKISALV